MRRDLSKPDVPWGVNIPVEDFNSVSSLLPIYGSKSWIIEQGIRSFLNLMENPQAEDLRKWAHASIAYMMYEAPRAANLREINAKIPTDLYFRFSKLFPEHGAATWFTRRYIKFLVESLKGETTLEETIEYTINRAMVPDEVPPEPDMERETIHHGPDE